MCIRDRYGSRAPFYVSRVHRHQQPLPRPGHTKNTDLKGGKNVRSSLHASKGELQTICQDQNGGIQRLRHQQSEMWTTYAKQEWRLNACMSLAMYMSHTGNPVERKTTGLRTKFTLLRLHRLLWLGRVPCVEDRRIVIDILSGQVASDNKDTNLQQLRYRDVVKRDTKGLATNAKLDTWMILSSPLDFCFRPISIINCFCLLRNMSNKTN